jgi:lambda family phage portal protein
MGLLSSIFGGKPAQPRAKIIRASYDAAKTHDQNRRHWANADYLSADSAGRAEIRKILRGRSRYEFENNPYARGVAHTMANYVIGQGPRLQVLTSDPEANRQIEASFYRWARAVKFAQKLRTSRISKVISGDVFLQIFANPAIQAQGLPAIDINLIEADQVETPWALEGDASVIDGVKIDQYGNPVAYYILNTHPGDSKVYLDSTADTLPASKVIHLFNADRPGQHRGIPELAPALETFAQLRRYMQAVLSAAERAAETSLYFKTDSPPGEGAQVADDGTELGSLPAIEPRRNEAVFLPEGWEPFQLKAEQPTAEFAATVHQYLSEAGRVLQIPVMIVTGDASNHNFASGRLDYQAFMKMIDVERTDYSGQCLDPIFDMWIEDARLVDGLLPDAAMSGYVPRQWYWPGIEHVDELKAANAARVRIETGQSSIATENARSGYDWEEQQKQQADCLGLTIEDYRARLADKLLGAQKIELPEENENDETPN